MSLFSPLSLPSTTIPQIMSTSSPSRTPENVEGRDQGTKRLRTRRACDYCRVHRIRCDFGSPNGDGETCMHCRRFQIVCSKASRPPPDKRPRAAMKEVNPLAELESMQGIEPGYLGPSNLSQLVRDHCATSPAAMEKIRSIEDRLDIYGEAFVNHHDRGRLVGRPADIGETGRRRALAAATYSRVEDKLVHELGGESVLNDLMVRCQHSFLPLFPAVSVHESLGRSNPTQDFQDSFGNFHFNSTPPTTLPRVFRLMYCAITAACRTTPIPIRESLLIALNTALDAMDFSMGMASLANVQLHLLISVNDGLWKRGPMGRAVYAASRMAMGLALHRSVSTSIVPIAQINRRSRIWGACLIADRWMTLRLGQMPGIDLSYADTGLPSYFPDHVTVGKQPLDTYPCFRFHLEMTKLADLLGRAYQISCTPYGLERADDFLHFVWQVDYQSWRAQLPQSWPYSSRLDTPEAGPVMNLLTVAVLFTFVQPFFWPTRPIPVSMTYRPPESFREDLENMSRDAIEWACGAGAFYLDIWSMLLHPFVCCLMIQAKLACERNFTAGLLLNRGIDVVRDWASSGESPHFVAYKRSDIVEMVEILKIEPDVDFRVMRD